MRRGKRDRGKPIPVGDLQQIAKFRAELTVYSQMRQNGLGHEDAMRLVFADDLEPKP